MHIDVPLPQFEVDFSRGGTPEDVNDSSGSRIGQDGPSLKSSTILLDVDHRSAVQSETEVFLSCREIGGSPHAWNAAAVAAGHLCFGMCPIANLRPSWHSAGEKQAGGRSEPPKVSPADNLLRTPVMRRKRTSGQATPRQSAVSNPRPTSA